jgi:hypothetical protein
MAATAPRPTAAPVAAAPRTTEPTAIEIRSSAAIPVSAHTTAPWIAAFAVLIVGAMRPATRPPTNSARIGAIAPHTPTPMPTPRSVPASSGSIAVMPMPMPSMWRTSQTPTATVAPAKIADHPSGETIAERSAVTIGGPE